MGVRKRFRFTEREAVLQVRSDRQRFPPYGLQGGRPGAPGRNLLIQGGVAQAAPSKLTTLIHDGDSLRPLPGRRRRLRRPTGA